LEQRSAKAAAARRLSSPAGQPGLRRLGTDRPAKQPRLQFRWAAGIVPKEWALYRQAMEAVRKAGVRFLLGGGFALATFTGRWRDTKDIDLYIHPQDREAIIAALNQAGFLDYYDQLPYDRKWIYRSVKADVIVDIIWSMANQRAQVDELWFQRAGSVTIRGEKLWIIPREEFMWCKLYILQRDHCDWTDLFNLLYTSGPQIDWRHLQARLEDDVPLLRGMLTVYGWLCPKQLLKLPRSLWSDLKMEPPVAPPPKPGRERIRLLDSRVWFAASQAKGKKLDV
jgi:hypothetical protein